MDSRTDKALRFASLAFEVACLAPAVAVTAFAFAHTGDAGPALVVVTIALGAYVSGRLAMLRSVGDLQDKALDVLRGQRCSEACEGCARRKP